MQQQQQVNQPTSAHRCEYDGLESEPTTPTWDAAPLAPAPAVALPPVRKPAHHVKLVLVGDSGVGKTSLRQRYLSDTFSTSYKATIGCDYVVKALTLQAPSPDPSNSSAPVQPAALSTPDVQLAIWDTAGQERYASLSTAFFRGADAVVFVYDVGSRASLTALERWWAVFREKCPVREGAERAFPVVVVGNKADVAGTRESGRKDEDDDCVTEAEVRELWERLIPPPPRPPPVPVEAETGEPSIQADEPSSSAPAPPVASSSLSPSSPPRPAHHSIQISQASPPLPHHNHTHTLIAGSSASHYQTPSSSFSSALTSALSEHPPIGPPPPPPFASTLAAGGYHLPPAASSSSIYSFKTARSTQTVAFPSSASGLSQDWDTPSLTDREHRRNRSTSSKLSFSSSASAASEAPSTSTVRPRQRSLVAQQQPQTSPPSSLGETSSVGLMRTRKTSLPMQPPPLPPPPPTADSSLSPIAPTPPDIQPPQEGPSFFLACSAKTGEGVRDVFEHVALAVGQRREWDERWRLTRGWEGEVDDDRVNVGQGGGGAGLRRWCAC